MIRDAAALQLARDILAPLGESTELRVQLVASVIKNAVRNDEAQALLEAQHRTVHDEALGG